MIMQLISRMTKLVSINVLGFYGDRAGKFRPNTALY